MLVSILLLPLLGALSARAQDCLCLTGDFVNIRDAPCGAVVGSGNSGQCYEDRGGQEVCDLDGVTHTYREVTFSANSGWISGDYLTPGDCPSGDQGNCDNVVIVTREEWGARPPRSSTPLGTPVTTVFVHHTVTAECTNQADCEAIVRDIQDLHMDSNGYTDIGYNFLVGSDGQAYEGRGFDIQGAHTCCGSCNGAGIGISLIGNFETNNPPTVITEALKNIIDCAVRGNYVIAWDSLRMFGHRDACSTACPGQYMYNILTGWPWYGGGLPCSC